VFEKGAKVNTVVFDKTGTITCGKLVVRGEEGFGVLGYGVCKMIMKAAEELSVHPIAKAVCEEFKDIDSSLVRIENFEEHEGIKCTAILEDKRYQVRITNNKNLALEEEMSDLSFIYLQIDNQICYKIGLEES